MNALQHSLAERVTDLQLALVQVKQLKGMLPICSYCKKVRDDQSYWQQIESFINERTGSEFSHSVCPDCYEQHITPELRALGLGHLQHPECRKKAKP